MAAGAVFLLTFGLDQGRFTAKIVVIGLAAVPLFFWHRSERERTATLITLLGGYGRDGAAGTKTWLLLPMIVTWLAVVIAFGYVSLGSIMGAVALVVAIACTSPGAPLLAFGILSLLLILYTHRSNLARMRAGTESRARRLWLLGTRRGRA